MRAHVIGSVLKNSVVKVKRGTQDSLGFDGGESARQAYMLGPTWAPAACEDASLLSELPEPSKARVVVLGRVARFLEGYLGLTGSDLVNLTALYLATLIMRAAAFAGIAVMEHVMYPNAADAFWYGVLFTIYPLAEILTVGYFGTLCDRFGRKGVLVAAHGVTAAAVFLFIPTLGLSRGIQPYLVGVLFTMFGVGAAMKVASTLAMVNDHTHLENRAQLMAVFDIVTFGGFAIGFGAGFVALLGFGWSGASVLLAAGLGVLLSVAMVQVMVRETQAVRNVTARAGDLLRSVFHDRDILKLLPVYIPVVALYGYVISFAERLIVPAGSPGGSTGSILTVPLIAVVGAFAGPLVVSMVLMGRYSDHRRLRRPFMGAGLLCFGGLAILMSHAQLNPASAGGPLGSLYPLWPLVAILSFGAGTFPPAALAYLGDIVKRDVSGTSFGIYSIIFGSGLIVGPVLGGTLTEMLGPLAFIVIALTLIAISGVAVLFLRESARIAPDAVTPVPVSADPPENVK